MPHILKHDIGKLFLVDDFGKRGQSITVAFVNIARFDESLSFRKFGSEDEEDEDRDEDQPEPEASTRSDICPVYMVSLDDRLLCHSACTSVLLGDGEATTQLTPLMKLASPKVVLLDV